MIRCTGNVLIFCAATAAVTGLTAGPAWAATTWTVKPGGSVTLTSGTLTLKDTTTGGSSLLCSSTVKGSLKKGSGLPGAGIGGLTSAAFTSCPGSPWALTAGPISWPLNAVFYRSATHVTTGTITGIHAVVSHTTGPFCSASLDGTSATADNGKLTVTYTNSTGKLRILKTGANLVVYNSNCPDINDGDHATLSGTYTASPKQTITRQVTPASPPAVRMSRFPHHIPGNPRVKPRGMISRDDHGSGAGGGMARQVRSAPALGRAVWFPVSTREHRAGTNLS
jgi:hypothetical protein